MNIQKISEQHPEWTRLITAYLPWLKTFKVWVLILVGTFAYGALYPGVSMPVFANKLMLVGPLVWEEPWRLFTYILMHGSWLHLLMNTLAFYQLAQFCEILYGTWRFQLIFILSGILGGVASVWWNPYVNTVGASGAIMGLMGAILAYTVVLKDHLPADLKSQMIRDVVVTCGLTAFLGFTIPNIDNAAHLGGFISGFVGGILMAPRPLEKRLIARVITMLSTFILIGIYALPYSKTVEDTYQEDIKFENTLLHVWSVEEQLNIKHKTLISKAEQTSYPEWESEYTAQIIKPLEDIELSVASINLYPDSKKKIEYSVLVRYIKLKLKEADTVKTWVRTRDIKMMEMLPKYNEEYESLIKTLKGIK